MHIFKHNKQRRALITFPKVAGSTIQTLLTPQFELRPDIKQHKNLVGWKTVQLSGSPDTFFDLRKIKHSIPEDFTVTILYRNPIERYISGMKTMLMDEGPGLIRYYDNPDNDFWSQKKPEWYEAYLKQLTEIAGLNYDYDNVHTMRIMLYIFIVGLEFPNVEFVHVNEFDSWLKRTHDLPDTYDIIRENNHHNVLSAKLNKVLSKQFEDDDAGIGFYISLDMRMYEHLQMHGSVTPTFLRDLGLIGDIFQEVYPVDRNLFTNPYPQSRWYIAAMMEWMEHGTCVPDSVREQINTHIIQVIGRYISVTKNGDKKCMSTDASSEK